VNLLIVSQHFYPDNFRINDIAQALVEQGHRVTVLTSRPDYATGRVPADCKERANRDVTWEGVRVIRTFSVERRHGVLFRALNYVSFCLSSTWKARRLKERFDAVMCYQTSPVLMANAARAYAKKRQVPFLLYCLDLWPESLKAWHVGEGNPLFKLMHRYSRNLYNDADLVAVTSKPFMEYLGTVNGVPAAKMRYLPQHAEPLALADKAAGDTTVFAFGGNIGSVQNVECILHAVAHLRDEDGFAVEIYGDGSELPNCKALAAALQVEDKVTFFGRVDWQTLKANYERADAFLLTLKSEGIIGQTVPAKLQEYMSGGRPVIAAIGGAAADVIREADCGLVAAADDSEGLAEAMRAFMHDRAAYTAMGQNGQAYFNAHFTKATFIETLERYFDEIR